MKKLIVILILLLVLAGGAFYYLQDKEYVVTLSEEDLQEQLDEAFPVEQQHLVLLTLRLTDPKVQLVEGAERVHYEMRASVDLGPVARQLSGAGRISGRLRYDPDRRQLYLHESTVEALDIDGVPEEYEGRVREAATIAAREHLNRHPVYTLDEELMERLPGAVELRSIQVVDGELRVGFGLRRGGGADTEQS